MLKIKNPRPYYSFSCVELLFQSRIADLANFLQFPHLIIENVKSN